MKRPRSNQSFPVKKSKKSPIYPPTYPPPNATSAPAPFPHQINNNNNNNNPIIMNQQQQRRNQQYTPRYNNNNNNGMMRVLNVAEKPSAAKKISQLLVGNPHFRRGHSTYNPIYEFTYKFQGRDCLMVFTSVSGHLQQLDFSLEMRGWYKCDPHTLIDPTTQVFKSVKEGMRNIEKTLKQEARKSAMLFLWLDGDLEGENISFEVLEICQSANNNLKIERGNVKRAKFSSFTKRDIQRALNNLVVPNSFESFAVDARQEIDLRTGAAFTRFQTMNLKNFNIPPNSKNGKSIISFGTCQFPTLGFIVERYEENKKFVPEKFWRLSINYSKENGGECMFWWDRGRFFDRHSCLVIYEMILEIKEAEVTNMVQRRVNRLKPKPLNTLELQKLGTRHLRMSAQEIMSVAEGLYNKAIISYPRTETDRFKFSEQELKGFVQNFVGNGEYGNYANSLLNNGKYGAPRAGMTDDNAHPPIHPVKSVDSAGLSNDEKKVYELVVRHFLASLSKNAVASETKVDIRLGDEIFHTRGLMIIEKNYLEIYKYEHWAKKTIPNFQKGMKFIPKAIYMNEGKTQAPPLLSERDLISKMDKNGIGTDATIAQHIQTIQDRKYCKKVGTVFEPTKLGLALVHAYNEMKLNGVTKPHLRMKVEEGMKDICQRKVEKQEMLNEILGLYHRVFGELKKQKEVLINNVRKYFNPN